MAAVRVVYTEHMLGFRTTQETQTRRCTDLPDTCLAALFAESLICSRCWERSSSVVDMYQYTATATMAVVTAIMVLLVVVEAMVSTICESGKSTEYVVQEMVVFCLES